jgi:hypothetical protein
VGFGEQCVLGCPGADHPPPRPRRMYGAPTAAASPTTGPATKTRLPLHTESFRVEAPDVAGRGRGERFKSPIVHYESPGSRKFGGNRDRRSVRTRRGIRSRGSRS